ncbi:LPS-assembly protein LptD [Sabulicella rubraurantiaca]|uniref:LPS-assembly protein LptD n=1 Tax=Sabulicella rubraurantiaca TaxID=2811429 RepID=UPI001A95F874|nr:LPS assembly protein LptD [Sabulicella rubraurantiaca]
MAAPPPFHRGWSRHSLLLGGAAGLALAVASGSALAQGSVVNLAPSAEGLASVPGPTLRDLPALPPAAPSTPRSEAQPSGGEQPVTFTAEEVEYDRERGIVTARGNVEAWQGERFLRAQEFIYARETGVAILRGQVQLIEADGTILYAEEVELTGGFRDGVLREVRARLAQNARMAANGARRTGGTVTDLARVVYSSCNLCAEDPQRPPLWQMRARLATQDREAQRISYRDATIQIGGVPVLYTPFFSHPDPQSPRASGFLFPTLGYTRFLGAFAEVPYFWAIDDTQDLLVTPIIAQHVLPNLGLEYRRRFNNGELQIQGSIGYFDGNDAERLSAGLRTSPELSGHIFARGRVALNENWRAGFNLNRASSEQYLRTYRFDIRRFLVSDIYAEGFWGTESYARVDVRAYQGLRSTDNLSQTPYVTPNAFYEWAPGRKILGGYLTVDSGLLGLTRPVGAWSQRVTARARWDRPFHDAVGGIWTVRAQGDLRGVVARGQEKLTVPQPAANGEHVAGNFRLALDWRMPLVRDAGAWGSQLIEPRVQVVTGPSTGRQTMFPNEDAVDFEFNDANLFQLDRFTGRDRFEGGTRVDAALRGAWSFPNGGRVEGIVGRSYRMSDEAIFPRNTGLERRWSDYVGRVGISPVSWLDLTGRTRLDSETGQHRQSEAVARLSLGRVGPVESLSFTAGYLYAPPLPFLTGDQGRNEVSFGVGGQVRSQAGGVWRLNASVRYDVRRQEPVAVIASGGYEDECFIVEGRLLRRFASDPVTNREYLGNTVFLVRVGFKTVGDYFLRAI